MFENESIEKSAEDKRQYRALDLTNGMKIMLVSDPDTDKSSAAMDVYIGQLNSLTSDSTSAFAFPEFYSSFHC